jgi:5'-phosphate synthase pdxT subunit
MPEETLPAPAGEQAHRNEERPRIGVLAIQGDFAAHVQALEDAGADAVEVRNSAELAGLDGLVLPGGESTTFLKFLERDGLLESLQRFVAEKPAFGTCAGCIFIGYERLSSGTAEPGRHGHQRRTKCLWSAD